MAGSGDRHQSRRRRRSGGEIEEGEVVSDYYTSSDTDTDDEDARYYLHPLPLHEHRQAMMVTVARPGPGPVQEGVVGGGGSAGSSSTSRSTTARASSPTSSLGSDGTISDHAYAGVDAAAVTALFPACPVCHRQFHSSKAVHGHMRVHAHAQPKEAEKMSATVCAVDEVADSVSVSTATLVEEPKISDDPTKVQLASSEQVVSEQVVPSSSRSSDSASVQKPCQSTADQSMAIVVAGAVQPAAVSDQVNIAAMPPTSQQVAVSPPVAPAPEPAAAYPHPPAAAQQHAFAPPPPAAAVAPLHAFHGPLHMIPHQDLAAPRGFSCKECYRWFPTHQGLGGHAAGHKNRRIAAEAAAAIAAGIDPIAVGGPRQEKLHTCKVCGEVYTSGVRLGGHMRKHYTGKPIVPRKRARLLFPPDVLGFAIPAPAPQAPAAEVAAAPAQAPAVPAGCLRIFGVTIVPEAKKEEDEP